MPATKTEKKKTETKAASTDKVKVTQTGSPIARTKDQRETLVGLGLNKIGRSKVLENNSCTQGMITKVAHLIKVENV